MDHVHRWRIEDDYRKLYSSGKCTGCGEERTFANVHSMDLNHPSWKETSSRRKDKLLQ